MWTLSVFAAAVGASAKTALLVIDVQNCFLEASCTTSKKDGSLAVPACHILPKINALRANKSCLFDEIIFTRDFHPKNHISFGSTHGLDPFSHLSGKGGLPLKCTKDGLELNAQCCPASHVNASAVDCTKQLCPPANWNYTTNNSHFVKDNRACSICKANPEKCYETAQLMWTDHCLQVGDSTFPPTLTVGDEDIVVKKGANQYVDAYSAFMDNTKQIKTELDAVLQNKGILNLFVVGIATDVCVAETVLDALGDKTGKYKVSVVTDATAAVQGNKANYNSSVLKMKTAGATMVTTADVLKMSCPSTSSGANGNVAAFGAICVVLVAGLHCIW